MSKTICLCMIVKNESKIIEKCLNSIVKYLDYWIIYDTGSDDNTQEIILNYFKKKNLKGELFNSKWINFGYNRTELIKTAHKKCDYLLLLDADFQVNILNKNFKKKLNIEPTAYLIKYEGNLNYKQLLLVSGLINCEYKGITHEYITSNDNYKLENGNFITIYHNLEGFNRENKFIRDIKLLLNGIKEEPNNSRYCFYLAQSYKDSGQYDNAIKWYNKRISMKGWSEEIYYSLYSLAMCKIYLNKDFENEIIYDLLKTFNYKKHRLEALYEIVKYFREKGKYLDAFGYGILGKDIKYNENNLFIIKDIYDYKYLDELSIVAYYAGFYKYSYSLIIEIIINDKYCNHLEDRFIENLKYSSNKLNITLLNKCMFLYKNLKKCSLLFQLLYNKINFIEKIKTDNYKKVLIEKPKFLLIEYTLIELGLKLMRILNCKLILVKSGDERLNISNENLFVYNSLEIDIVNILSNKKA